MTNLLIPAGNIAANSQNTTFLFKNIWKENTTAILHAPVEVDKVTTALDIAADLCKSDIQVVYVDIQKHLDDHRERLSKLDNMFVLRPGYDSPDDPTDYGDIVIRAIEETATSSGIRTFIIDSVTRIAALSFGRNASPAYIMKRLVSLQVRLGLSLLVIAHDSTKTATRALINLADCEIPLSSDDTATVSDKPQSTLGKDSVKTSSSPSPGSRHMFLSAKEHMELTNRAATEKQRN